MIDNLEKCLPFINPTSSDDFWYLQILQRKKENTLLTSNSRVIKNYYIKDKQYLLDRYEEIKTLCNVFNARASLRLNKRSYKKVGFKALINMSNTMSNKEFQFLPKSYDRAVGSNHNDKDKKWILDIDATYIDMDSLKTYVNNCRPFGEAKIIEVIPSKSGVHIITSPFDLRTFKQDYEDIEIHKDNPTNLYIP